MKTKLTNHIFTLLVLLIGGQLASAQGTAFTYQGRLTAGSNAATGFYDLRSILYSAEIGGSQVGNVLTNAAVTISDGLFTTTLAGVSASWPQVSPPYQTNATTISVTFTNMSPSGNQFYRLHKP